MGMKRWLADAWQMYSRLGVAEDSGTALTRRIILSNQVAAVLLVLGIGVSLYFIGSDSSRLTVYWFAFLLLSVWVMPFLNLLGHSALSRHMLSSMMPLFIVGIVAHTRIATPDEVHGASYYIPRFYLMAISFFPLLLFTNAERGRMYVSLGVNLLILLFFNELLDLFGAGMGLLEPMVEDAFFISVSSVICLAVIGSGFFFLNRMNTEYEVRIEELLKDSEEKNVRISSAINYARNIQQTIMPPKELEARWAERLFTFFRPVDVVSGDFYMIKEDGDRLLIAVIDCTGHGVPGAFVSLLAHASLQQAVREHGIGSPAAIVSEADRLFHQEFSRSGNPQVSDGMDLVLCSLDRQRMQLHISGANLSAYVVSNGHCTAHACQRGSISTLNPERTFTDMVVQVAEGDMVYLTSDGLSDQFGGEKGRRFGRRALNSLFIPLSEVPLDGQAAHLHQWFREWKGEHPQVDDVCVMGLRI